MCLNAHCRIYFSRTVRFRFMRESTIYPHMLLDQPTGSWDRDYCIVRMCLFTHSCLSTWDSDSSDCVLCWLLRSDHRHKQLKKRMLWWCYECNKHFKLESFLRASKKILLTLMFLSSSTQWKVETCCVGSVFHPFSLLSHQQKVFDLLPSQINWFVAVNM